MRIEFLTASFPLNNTMGNKDSLHLLEHLSKAQNLDIFRSKLALIIEYKWQKAYTYVLTIGLFYMLYAVLLIVDCCYKNHTSRVVMIVYSGFILAIEAF